MANYRYYKETPEVLPLGDWSSRHELAPQALGQELPYWHAAAMAEGGEEESEDDSVTVSVRSLGGAVTCFRVPRATTARALKIRLARSCGSPPYAQRLLQGERILEDDASVESAVTNAPALELLLVCTPCELEAGTHLIDSARFGNLPSLREALRRPAPPEPVQKEKPS
eukprot:s597_g14.t1